eukprot:scaffold224715_cov30-Prasinocladus_malaysianus.AAC.2
MTLVCFSSRSSFYVPCAQMFATGGNSGRWRPIKELAKAGQAVPSRACYRRDEIAVIVDRDN